jgi:molybdenum-dependent DNA-binding transcriptional regulator ModE
MTCNVIGAATVNAMTNAESASIVYDPAAAADLLGISASGLRRLAPIYESVYGDLKRVGQGDESKRSREWPTEAIERLQTARGVTGRGRPYRTIEAALAALRSGVEVGSVEIDFGGRQAGADVATSQALQVLIGEIRLLRDEVAELKQGRELSQPHAEIKNLAPADRQHSLLLRLALWAEEKIRGK